jgi:hypothetical protein
MTTSRGERIEKSFGYLQSLHKGAGIGVSRVSGRLPEDYVVNLLRLRQPSRLRKSHLLSCRTRELSSYCTSKLGRCISIP